MNPNGTSIYNFIVIVNNKEFLYCLRDLSGVSHTAKVIEEEIERVIMAIGPKKFSAIVTDNASAMMNARKFIQKSTLTS
jgi:Protein of unknown function (DUF 659)